MIHCALNCQQQRIAGNNFEEAADFLSLTVCNYCRFVADGLWICVMIGH